MEKLLGELRKADSSNVKLTTVAHLDDEKLLNGNPKYDAKCEGIQRLQTHLQELKNNIGEGVGDEGNSPSSSIAADDDGLLDGNAASQDSIPLASSRNVRRHNIPLDMGSRVANKAYVEMLKNVEQLNALVFPAHAAIPDIDEIKMLFTSHK